MLTVLLAALLGVLLLGVGLDDAEQRRTVRALRGWILAHDSGRVVVTTRPDATDDDLAQAAAMLLAGRHDVTAGGM